MNRLSVISHRYLLLAICFLSISVSHAATDNKYELPAVKEPKLSCGTGGSVNVGQQVTVICPIGYGGTVPSSYNGSLLFEVLVNGKVFYTESIPEWDKQGAVIVNKTTSYLVKMTESGKPLWFECVIDRAGKVKSINGLKNFCNVAGKPWEQPKASNPGPNTYKAYPQGVVVPPPPQGSSQRGTGTTRSAPTTTNQPAQRVAPAEPTQTTR